MAKEPRMRRWSNEEITQFARVLVDEKYSFVHKLELKALKKASNEDILANVQKFYDERLAIDEVKQKIKSEIGERKFKAQPLIETSITKLRIKYKWMKNQRNRFHNRVGYGNGKFATAEKPEWLKILDPVLAQALADLNVVATDCDVDNNSADDDKSSDNEEDEEESMMDSGCGDLPSFCSLRSENRRDASVTWDEQNESDSTSPSADMVQVLIPGLNIEGRSSNSAANEGPKETDVNRSVRMSRIVTEKEATSPVIPMSRKRKIKENSYEQALRDLSESVQKLNESIEKRMELMRSEEKARDEAFLKFHERQCELNRQHELRMMEMMLRFVQPQPAQVAYSIPTGESVSMSTYCVDPRDEHSSGSGRNSNGGRCCGRPSSALNS